MASPRDAAAQAEDFVVFNGPDSLIHRGFVEGCAGCVSGLANVAPREAQSIWSHYRAGDMEASAAAQAKLASLRESLFKIAFAPAVVKRAVRLLGYPVGNSKYPVRLSAEQDAAILQVLQDHGIQP